MKRPASPWALGLLALGALLLAAGAHSALAAVGVIQPVFLPVVYQGAGGTPALVFVSRQIPPNGSIYWDVPADLPGVGAHSRFRVAAPGQLLVREPGGQIRVLVDGSAPTAASLFLIDVNAPDVSYDGSQIVFAGLPQGEYDLGPTTNPGAWRLYVINADGTGLHQLTFSDQALNLAQFGPAAGGLAAYDDTDPAWLPSGQVVFSSTRWPAFAQYSGVRATNLYVVDADGDHLRRITSERNGADRPLIDPLTGKIVYARWWRNHRFALNDLTTVVDTINGGFSQKDGLSANRNLQMDGSGQYADYLWRNAWQAATINPNGTGLAMWAGSFRDEAGNHMYGGAFTPAGVLIANFFPMYNMTEAAGFGGLRRYERGPGSYTPLLGITSLTLDYVHPANPTSYGVFNGSYAAEPAVLPDGRLALSWAADVGQDYGLYTAQADGTGLTLLYDRPGTTELRARVLASRPLPPVLPGPTVTAALLPPPASAITYTQDGTFQFVALNVYFNAPVDWDIVNAPAVGSAATIRFFLDQQRTSPGSFPNLDWPILLGEAAVGPFGFVFANAPANLSLFEQLRGEDGSVPLTTGPQGADGAGHVTGLNYGPPGAVARCVGCHAGHTLIPVPADNADAIYSNLAPGASVVVSSTRDADYNGGLIDRRVLKGEIWRYWTSADSAPQDGQWVRLDFPVTVSVRTVRLYNPRPGDEANSTLQVHSGVVDLCADTACTSILATQAFGALAGAGTDVAFADVTGVRSVRVTLTDVSGTFYGLDVAGLAEIEVIAKGE